jgi:hypothetical protein
MAKLLDPRTGLSPGAAIDRDGMRTVLALRSRYGEPRKRLDDVDTYLALGSYRRVSPEPAGSRR